MQHLDSPIQLEITARRLSELQHECDEITVIERRRNRPRCMLSMCLTCSRYNSYIAPMTLLCVNDNNL